MINRRAFLAGATGLATVVVAACAKGRTRSPATVPETGSGGPAGSDTTVVTATAPSGPATFVRAGPTGSTGVALTFHGSGAVSLTDALLARAAALTAPITVFAVGTWLSQYPGTAAKILAGGHELANHTWSHADILHLPQPGVRSEIVKCRDEITAQTGVRADYFRPSQTDVPNDLILAEAGLAGYRTVVGYDVDPLDYTDPGATLVLSRTRAALHPGAIVSLHLGHPGTVTAFDGIVRAIRARGLKPVLIRDLLSQG